MNWLENLDKINDQSLLGYYIFFFFWKRGLSHLGKNSLIWTSFSKGNVWLLAIKNHPLAHLYATREYKYNELTDFAGSYVDSSEMGICFFLCRITFLSKFFFHTTYPHHTKGMIFCNSVLFWCENDIKKRDSNTKLNVLCINTKIQIQRIMHKCKDSNIRLRVRRFLHLSILARCIGGLVKWNL